MKILFLILVVFQFCSSQNIPCNTTTCNPIGGICSSNTTCTCYQNNEFGYWTEQGCFKCLNQFDIKTNCKICRTNYGGVNCTQCIGNFDISKDCLACKPGFYGKDCNSCNF